MKNPRYMEELLKIIFVWLGVMFVCSGILCVLGVMKPSAHSMIQDPTILGVVFSALGAVFVFAYSCSVKHTTNLLFCNKHHIFFAN